jgi:hypothetical protein
MRGQNEPSRVRNDRSVQQNLTFGRDINTCKEPENRRFAAAGWSDDRQSLTGLDLQRNVRERG